MLGDSIRRRQGRRGRTARPARAPARREPRIAWGKWILVGLVLGLTGFGAGYGISVLAMFPTPPESGDTVVAPDLTGLTVEQAERELDARGLSLGPVLEMPHSRKSAGAVIGQAPVPGQRVAAGAQVQLAVSTGPPRVFVPDLVGLPADRATDMAQRIGFDVEQRSEPAPVAPGQVIRVDPRPGSAVVLPGRLVLVVSSGLPFLPEFDTLDSPAVAPNPPAPEPPLEPTGEPAR